MTDTRAIRVLTYSRLSNDPQGRRATHATQKRGIDAVIDRNGWPEPAPEDRFSDTDKSAGQEDVERPGWDRLLETLASIDRRTTRVILVGYSQERLNRLMGDMPAIANLIERKHGELWTDLQGHINVKKGGRAGYYVNGVVAANETELNTARTTEGIATAAMDGKAHGTESYGWDRVYDTVGAGKPVARHVVNMEQAAVVDWLAGQIIAGASLRGLADWLNANDYPAPGAGRVLKRDPVTREPVRFAGDQWCSTKIREVVTRKANVGVRVHVQGVGDDAETFEYPATWDAIVDDDTYAQVLAVLGAPERKTSRTNVARHWLSGGGLCGPCGLTVTVQPVKKGRSRTGKKRSKYNAYKCPKGHVIRAEAKTDMVVEQALLALLSDPSVRAVLRRDDTGVTAAAAASRVAALRAKLVELETEYRKIDGGISAESFGRMSRDINADIVAAEKQLARRRDDTVYAHLIDADDIGAAWDATPLDQRRAIAAALIVVTLHPATKRGRNAFDPATISVTLRRQELASAA